MSCKKCENAQKIDRYIYYRFENGNIEIRCCEEHFIKLRQKLRNCDVMLEALKLLTVVCELANNLQHAGLKVDAEIWADMYQQTNKAKEAIAAAESEK